MDPGGFEVESNEGYEGGRGVGGGEEEEPICWILWEEVRCVGRVVM